MKKLVQGIVDFRKSLTKEKRALFAKLALGQKPDALFITCSDSRVAPNVFASSNPGDVFVLRNVGNLIPPVTASDQEASASSALEFAVLALKVSDIIVCGHSECGAMQALAYGIDAGWCDNNEYGLSDDTATCAGLSDSPSCSGGIRLKPFMPSTCFNITLWSGLPGTSTDP